MKNLKKGICILSGLAAAVLFSSVTVAQPAPATTSGPNDTIYMYKGADRDQKVLEAAKKEGTLTLYSSLSNRESTPLIAAFEKKYGIKVVFWRAPGFRVAQRFITEGQAGRHAVDVIETNGTNVEQVAREGLLSEFYSPHFADLPADAFPPNRLWVSDRLNMFVVAYNKNEIKREDLPKELTGFLDPKWKEKISLESTDVEWMATIIKKMGEKKGTQFFKDLAATNPQVRTSHILLAEMVAAGEVPVTLTVYNGQVESLKRNGAPIEWMAVQPAIGRPIGLGIAKSAPHPNAALLFADFILSPETQQMYADLGRIPASNKIQSKLKDFPYVISQPSTVLDENEKWTTLWNELFIKSMH